MMWTYKSIQLLSFIFFLLFITCRNENKEPKLGKGLKLLKDRTVLEAKDVNWHTYTNKKIGINQSTVIRFWALEKGKSEGQILILSEDGTARLFRFDIVDLGLEFESQAVKILQEKEILVDSMRFKNFFSYSINFCNHWDLNEITKFSHFGVIQMEIFKGNQFFRTIFSIYPRSVKSSYYKDILQLLKRDFNFPSEEKLEGISAIIDKTNEE